MNLPSPETIFFALAGGVLPALLWLWFWLQEDRLHPEPRGMIIRTFIAGMVAVPLVLPLEQLAEKRYALYSVIVVFLWACAEEIFKWGAAYFAALDTKEYDEPIDAVIYLLTAALGFAAMENSLFLVTSITKTSFVTSFVTGNLRFIGATLLHVLSSGVVGLFLGLSFYKGRLAKKLYCLFGLALAILLHTVFNLYIMRSEGTSIFIIFCFVWVAVILLIAGFEKVKRIKEWQRL
ncbi:MAG: PrsW family intramembrane metalloprotease [Candidatus Taylorbacteria bacterium]|nr:PrsW family intramembrane metalloprotease [Candidatus Taylorbacteria bacterium]